MNKLIGYFVIIIALLSFPGQRLLFSVVFFLSVLTFSLETVRYNRGKLLLFNEKNKFSIYFVILWLLYAVLTVFWVKDVAAWKLIVNYLFYLFYFTIFFINVFEEKLDIIKVFNIFTSISIVHNIIGWFQILTGIYIFPVNNETIFKLEKLPVSSFFNTNDFATFLLFSIFILLAVIRGIDKKISRFIYGVTVLSSIILLVMTQSRSNLIGLMMGMSFYLWFRITNKNFKFVVVFSLLLTGIVLMVQPQIISSILNEINTVLNFDFENETSSGGIRSNLIRNGIYFLQETKYFGVGAGNIEHWMQNFNKFPTLGTLNMHNWWIEILTSFGLLIFALFIIFYIKLFSSFGKIFNSKTLLSPIALSVQSIQIAFVVGSLASSSNMSRYWIWLFWAIAITIQGMEFNKKISSKSINL